MTGEYETFDGCPPPHEPEPRIAAGWSLRSYPADDEADDPAERRLTPRSVTLEYRSLLGWWDKTDFIVKAARMLDLGLGGVAVETDDPPPRDRDVWFCLVPGEERDCIPGEIVALERRPSGRFLSRVAFWNPCPARLLVTAIHGLVKRVPPNPPDDEV